MTITGITDDGKYEVSTWGMKLYYNPVKNEGDAHSFYVIDYDE